ncbi:DnaA N-terminal domain-containing protein [Archangium lansingense]|uniref:DnaA N-terminal domain-containing protein n=1 Tax=Archangium lansingense TaxID=2995310 RepID=UPI003B75F8E4
MTCATMPQELAELRAQLEQERLARTRAEARLEGFREAAALFFASRQAEASPQPRHALSRPQQRDSATPSVTAEDGVERKKRLGRERKKNQRIRDRSVTSQRDSVTPSVTLKEEKKNKTLGSFLPPSPPPVGRASRGTLAIVTVAARDAQRDKVREHRTPATLPPKVQSLRAGWNELVAPRGFPAWGERTSAKLLQDAEDALERRPLEDWLKAFALVPRSPVCRGELGSRQRMSLVWMLAGRMRDGYEPAEKLLGGDWSIDPEPTEGAPPGPVAAPLGGAELTEVPGDTPAANSWRRMLESLRADGKQYALSWLGQLRAREVREGHLVLEALDRFFVDWVRTHYGELLQRMVALEGFSGVLFTSPDSEDAP